MIAHVRRASFGGKNAIENVHPFVRELWGTPFAFAHNGDVASFAERGVRTSALPQTKDERPPRFRPVGDTDSEGLFCALLNHLAASFAERPPPAALFEAIDAFSRRACRETQNDFNERAINSTVICNYVLAAGPDLLFVFG